MARHGENSIGYDMRKKALAGLTDQHTIQGYRRSLRDFAAWAKAEGVTRLDAVDRDVIQAYERHLEDLPQGYSPATIHAKLAPVCKAAGVPMQAIAKPKRTADRIVRGRGETRLGRGDREATQERYARVVDLQACVGIRRAELGRLTGADWDGKYITVRRGKGGKPQRQYILPQDRATVARIFAGIAPNERVFAPEEMQSHINLHGMRAEHARECYTYYADMLARHPDQRAKLQAALLRRWEQDNTRLLAGHAPGSAEHASALKRYAALRARFKAAVDNTSPYCLRGANAQKALESGRETVYDRTALMAVSVFHLSHWRLDVTVTNYML